MTLPKGSLGYERRAVQIIPGVIILIVANGNTGPSLGTKKLGESTFSHSLRHTLSAELPQKAIRKVMTYAL
jgi:uncharacterized membrane protein